MNAQNPADLLSLFEQGGPLMWVILMASVVGLFFFLERMYTLAPQRVLPRAFVDRIRGMAARGETRGAQLLCEENGASVALMMAAALRTSARGATRAEIKESVEEVGGREVAHLDRHVEIVGTVASVTPLLGLLGTVWGMIQVFQRFVDAYADGAATPDVFATGIWTALITTAFGLFVAIPTLVLYKYLQGRNDRLIVLMEEDAMGLVDLLEETRRNGVARDSGGDSNHSSSDPGRDARDAGETESA